MTKVDFVAIAKELNDKFNSVNNDQAKAGITIASIAVATALAHRYPRFNTSKFLEACLK